jgi:hypothetical protein
VTATGLSLELADATASSDDGVGLAISRVRTVSRLSTGLLSLQLFGMLVFSTLQYRSFNLTLDFATYPRLGRRSPTVI